MTQQGRIDELLLGARERFFGLGDQKILRLSFLPRVTEIHEQRLLCLSGMLQAATIEVNKAQKPAEFGHGVRFREIRNCLNLFESWSEPISIDSIAQEVKFGLTELTFDEVELKRELSKTLQTMWRGAAQGLLDGRHNPSLTSFWNVFCCPEFFGDKRLARSAIGGPLVTI